MPLEDVAKRQISDTWQSAAWSGKKARRSGHFCAPWDAIFSATNGYIYKVGENSLGGQTVSVIGSGGRIYYYAHLDRYAPGLEVGKRVSTRTVLGYVGTTGNAQGTPPHLHFGVYTFNGAINPLPLLCDRNAPTSRSFAGKSTELKKTKLTTDFYVVRNIFDSPLALFFSFKVSQSSIGRLRPVSFLI